MHVERTFSVPRSVDEAFTYLADFTHAAEWDPGTVACTRTGGDGGVGTTYANTSEFMGRRVELTYETITHQPPSRLQLRGRNGRTVATDTMSFAAAGASTSITYRADFEFPFPVSVLAPLVVRRKLEKLADDTVAQITRSLT